MQERYDDAAGMKYIPDVSFSLKDLASGGLNTSCTVTVNRSFFMQIHERNLIFPTTMSMKQKITSFAILCLIFSCRYNPSMAIFKDQGKEPFSLLIKIVLDVTAPFGHDSEKVKEALWLSNDTDLCNEKAVHRMFSMILFKGVKGTVVANISYIDAMTNPTNREEFITPLELDVKFGSYYQSQQGNVNSSHQFPGIEGFPLAASRITIGLYDLIEGSHSRGTSVERIVSEDSNTVNLWLYDKYVKAIPITPYLFLIYTYNMKKIYFTKRCFHTTDICSANCICVRYHYYNASVVFPECTAADRTDKIQHGIFCNSQCGRALLSQEVTNALSYENLVEFLAVFQDPSTKIGQAKSSVLKTGGAKRSKIGTSNESDPQSESDSDSKNVRQLIPDAIDDKREYEELDGVEDENNNEEDGINSDDDSEHDDYFAEL